ncbi:MAG: twin-arginine translocase subunit TatC [Candidatus Cloacimonadota bacterium]|nr:MAG: twin-arginine translocase subunit TatC [Candidatus Cloacimonadota bacterium]
MEEVDENQMSLIAHLDELRNMFIFIIIGVFIGTLICMGYSEVILQEFIKISKGKISFIMISPTEGFFTQLKLGLLGGIVLSFPNSIIQFWRFIGPGLEDQEKKFLYLSTPFMIALFLGGVSLAFFYVIPFGLDFLLSFQFADVSSTISIEKYVSFCFTLLLVFGFVFELPIFIILLYFIGLLQRAHLIKFRKHVFVSMFIFAAVITPPDIITQIMVAIPMIILYEISIQLLWFFDKKKAEAEKNKSEDDFDYDC